MKNTGVIILLVLMTTMAQAKELSLRVFDSVTRQNLPVTVDTVTGQYRVDVQKLFSPLKIVDQPNWNLCGQVEQMLTEAIAANTANPVEALPRINRGEMHWRLFYDFRDLSRLERELKRKLRRQGYRVRQLTNLTKAYVEQLDISEFSWDEEALSLRHSQVTEVAEKELRKILEEGAGYFQSNGSISSSTTLDALYCDLLNNHVAIEFKVKGYQNDYFDNTTEPIMAPFNHYKIMELSERFNGKAQAIVKSAEESQINIGSKDKLFVTSLAALAKLLYQDRIGLEKFTRGEFVDLSYGMIDLVTGLPKSIDEEAAIKIEKSISRGDFSTDREVPFEFHSKF